MSEQNVLSTVFHDGEVVWGIERDGSMCLELSPDRLLEVFGVSLPNLPDKCTCLVSCTQEDNGPSILSSMLPLSLQLAIFTDREREELQDDSFPRKNCDVSPNEYLVFIRPEHILISFRSIYDQMIMQD